MQLIASEKIFFESPYPKEVFCYTPFLARAAAGRIVASFDLGGPGTAKLEGPLSDHGDFACNQVRILVSDDHGHSWRETGRLPMLHCRVFQAGERLYAIGQSHRLLISVSRDNGDSWSPVSVLESEHRWEPGAAIDCRDGVVRLVMEQRIRPDDWPGMAQVLLTARTRDDLTRPESWRFSAPWVLEDHVTLPQPCGVPFYPAGDQCPGAPDPRFCGRPGGLETNVMRIHDPDHLLYNAAPDAVVLLARLHSGATNLALMLRGGTDADGQPVIDTFTTPGGAPLVFVPLPGGHMRFQIVWDEPSRRYWMVGSQATDSLTRPDRLPADRYNLPDNERNRMVLHFSRNLRDWCFAGVVAIGTTPRDSRHYASLLVDGEDLLILSRSGDRRAASAHNGNLLTLHRVSKFRQLIY